MMKLPATRHVQRVHADGRQGDDRRQHRPTRPTRAKTFALKIEFVDKAGNVVATQDVSVGPVAPHKSAAFQTVGTGAGIVAFRYARSADRGSRSAAMRARRFIGGRVVFESVRTASSAA